MVVHGRVHNGVVVLEGHSLLPEGLAVIVTVPNKPEEKPIAAKRRIQLPLVSSTSPGSLPLTAERIAELLEADDLSP